MHQYGIPEHIGLNHAPPDCLQEQLIEVLIQFVELHLNYLESFLKYLSVYAHPGLVS